MKSLVIKELYFFLWKQLTQHDQNSRELDRYLKTNLFSAGTARHVEDHSLVEQQFWRSWLKVSLEGIRTKRLGKEPCNISFIEPFQPHDINTHICKNLNIEVFSKQYFFEKLEEKYSVTSLGCSCESVLRYFVNPY